MGRWWVGKESRVAPWFSRVWDEERRGAAADGITAQLFLVTGWCSCWWYYSEQTVLVESYSFVMRSRVCLKSASFQVSCISLLAENGLQQVSGVFNFTLLFRGLQRPHKGAVKVFRSIYSFSSLISDTFWNSFSEDLPSGTCLPPFPWSCVPPYRSAPVGPLGTGARRCGRPGLPTNSTERSFLCLLAYCRRNQISRFHVLFLNKFSLYSACFILNL